MRGSETGYRQEIYQLRGLKEARPNNDNLGLREQTLNNIHYLQKPTRKLLVSNIQTDVVDSKKSYYTTKMWVFSKSCG